MQTANDRYVVRLSGALAALLGDVELPEDELLGWLRAQGLITYPSPLLEGLLGGELPEVFAAEVLPRLDPTDVAMFGRVGKASRVAVVASGLPRAGADGGVPLRLNELWGSVERLAWARENGYPAVPRACECARRTCGCGWDIRVCQEAAARGDLEVLLWAREYGCPWEQETWEQEHEYDYEYDYEYYEWNINCCALAAEGGHLEVLKWLRFGSTNACPWDETTCANAAAGGHLEVLKWIREHGGLWNEWTCACAAAGGHLEVLKWARAHGCRWDAHTVEQATAAGHDDVLQWALANGCPPGAPAPHHYN